MANVVTMGPPPSPKEPRRSGRRSVPAASTSKSPTGSPTTETAPKPKDSTQRPPLPSSSSSGRGKRTKNEDVDDTLDEGHKNGINGTANGRAKRKGKEKEKGSLTIDTSLDDDHPKAGSSTAGADAQEEEEEEAGVTRCICQESGACRAHICPAARLTALFFCLKALTSRKLQISWLNATAVTRGSMVAAWDLTPLIPCLPSISAKSADPTCIPIS